MDPAPSPAAHHMFPYLVSRTDITRFKRAYSIRLRTAAHLFPVAVLVWTMAMWCANVNKLLSPAVRHEALVSSTTSRLPMDTGWLGNP